MVIKIDKGRKQYEKIWSISPDRNESHDRLSEKRYSDGGYSGGDDTGER